MYQFSRSIFRELAPEVVPGRGEDVIDDAACASCAPARRPWSGSRIDRHYFAKPVRTLFNDVRHFFPIGEQLRVYRVCERHMPLATEYVDSQLPHGHDVRRQPGLLPREHAQGHRVPARAAAGQQVLPVAQAPRRGVRGRSSRLTR